MYTIGQTPLARLRPEKLDDMAIKEQISMIQEVCGDIDPDVIAIIFHECEYNMQATIARIKSGDFEDGGWQTAKSNNKKKNHTNDQLLNGNTQSDSERSHSQLTSPSPSLRGNTTRGRRRKDHYQYPASSSRSNRNRRGNDPNRNPYIPSNTRQPPKTESPNPSETILSTKSTDEITPTPSSSTDEYEFIDGTSQSLTFDNSLQKNSLTTLTKSSAPAPPPPSSSSIPQQAVSMHPTIQLSIKPFDIQFGDIQWNDSIPITITPSNSPILEKSSSPTPEQQQTDVQEDSSSNYVSQQQLPTNDNDRELDSTIDRLASTSITNNSIEEISHLSDQLTEPIPTSTPQTNQPFIMDTLQNPTTPSAFTPYNPPTSGTFPSIPRDYSQWNQQQSTNYKPNPKTSVVQSGNFSQQTPYTAIQPQQTYFVGTYPYGTPALYPVFTPVEPWSTAGFDPYSTYSTTNYLPTYSTQQQYHPNTKHDQSPYDKDFFANYGQTRVLNADMTNSSQSPKDVPSTSKLSATAASFPQTTSPGTTVYLNPYFYSVPTTYYPSHQDRAIDNRNGASYPSGGNNNTNRNHYQQRTHNNSNWHS